VAPSDTRPAWALLTRASKKTAGRGLTPMKGFWEFWLVAALAIAVSLVALIAWTLR